MHFFDTFSPFGSFIFSSYFFISFASLFINIFRSFILSSFRYFVLTFLRIFHIFRVVHSSLPSFYLVHSFNFFVLLSFDPSDSSFIHFLLFLISFVISTSLSFSCLQFFHIFPFFSFFVPSIPTLIPLRFFIPLGHFAPYSLICFVLFLIFQLLLHSFISYVFISFDLLIILISFILSFNIIRTFSFFLRSCIPFEPSHHSFLDPFKFFILTAPLIFHQLVSFAPHIRSFNSFIHSSLPSVYFILFFRLLHYFISVDSSASLILFSLQFLVVFRFFISFILL